MQFLCYGFKCILLYFQLRAERFFFIHILYFFHLLFLPLLSSLVKKKNSNDKPHQKQPQYDAYDGDEVYFLVLSRHKNAIVNKEYKKMFKIIMIAKKFLIMSFEMPLIKLDNPYKGNPQQ